MLGFFVFFFNMFFSVKIVKAFLDKTPWVKTKIICKLVWYYPSF